MKLNWDIKNQLLDRLDETINSNTFFIELGIPEGEFDLSKTIVQHLKTGSFHHEIVKQDIYRGWNNYSEMVFPKRTEMVCVIPRPGNVWNGNEHINYENITRERVVELLHDMLTKGGKHFSISSHGNKMNERVADKLTTKLLNALFSDYEKCEAFRIEPNFLNQIDDYYSSGDIQLGYFENCGRDLALAFKMEESIYLLLTNGYG